MIVLVRPSWFVRSNQFTLPFFVNSPIAPNTAIRNATPTIIHMGESTHHHDQSILSSSFKTINAIVSIPTKSDCCGCVVIIHLCFLSNQFQLFYPVLHHATDRTESVCRTRPKATFKPPNKGLSDASLGLVRFRTVLVTYSGSHNITSVKRFGVERFDLI